MTTLAESGVRRLVKPLFLWVIFRVQLLIYQPVTVGGYDRNIYTNYTHEWLGHW